MVQLTKVAEHILNLQLKVFFLSHETFPKGEVYVYI